MVAQQQNAAQRATSGIPGIPGALPGTGAQALHTTVHSHTHSHMHGTVTHARNPSHAGAPGTGSSGSLHVSHRSARVAHADPTILSRPNVDPTARPLGTTHNRAGTSSSPALGAVAEPPAMHEDSEHLSVEQESTGTVRRFVSLLSSIISIPALSYPSPIIHTKFSINSSTAARTPAPPLPPPSNAPTASPPNPLPTRSATSTSFASMTRTPPSRWTPCTTTQA